MVHKLKELIFKGVSEDRVAVTAKPKTGDPKYLSIQAGKAGGGFHFQGPVSIISKDQLSKEAQIEAPQCPAEMLWSINQ